MAPELSQSWLELEKQLGGRSRLVGTPEEIRAQVQALGEMLASSLPPPSPAVSAKDGDVEGIKYRVYTPVDAVSKGPLPVGVFAHSGGFMTGNLEGEDAMCRIVTENIPSIIVSVDYRLSPEHKWPTQLQDTLSVYKWARQNASSIGGDPAKFYMIGGSAGGTLALAVANKIVSNQSLRDSIKGVVAMVPSAIHPNNVPAEYKSMFKSYIENGTDAPVIDGESMNIFLDAVGSKPNDSSAFVVLATENHENFPPTYITTCGADPLRDDGVIMEEVLKKAGVPVKRDHYPGLPHYFWLFPGLPEAEQYVINLLAGINWVIGQM